MDNGDFRTIVERRNLLNSLANVTLDENREDKSKWLWDNDKKIYGQVVL